MERNKESHHNNVATLMASTPTWLPQNPNQKIYIVSWQNYIKPNWNMFQTLKNKYIVNKNQIETMIEDWEICNGPNLTIISNVGISISKYPLDQMFIVYGYW